MSNYLAKDFQLPSSSKLKISERLEPNGRPSDSLLVLHQRYLVCLSRGLIVSELKLRFLIVRGILCNINFQLNFSIQFS